ncbi:MAG TPA: type I methionyl aminopeptidase [bacterium]|nr:type I methionyl aminopeptidase [Patescibacteria group bacterium]HPO11042.1 type I methionyl aminopeptidase [bacterium]
MAEVKTKEQIERIREASRILASILEFVLPRVKAGMSTKEIDEIIEKKIIENGAIPSCKGFYGFPACSCISVNEEVTHGIPRKNKILKNGDIVDIDVVIEYNKAFSDMSRTIGIGKISNKAKKLIRVTREAFFKGLDKARAGNTLNDIGYAIQEYVEKNNCSVVRDYVGHFIGEQMHEDPEVPNYYINGNDFVLQEGMVFCIEPMVNYGDYRVKTKGWDVKTADKSLSARFEDTILITKNGAVRLTKMNNEK